MGELQSRTAVWSWDTRREPRSASRWTYEGGSGGLAKRGRDEVGVEGAESGKATGELRLHMDGVRLAALLCSSQSGVAPVFPAAHPRCARVWEDGNRTASLQVQCPGAAVSRGPWHPCLADGAAAVTIDRLAVAIALLGLHPYRAGPRGVIYAVIRRRNEAAVLALATLGGRVIRRAE